MSLSVVILAAGKGTRMLSETPKVMHEVAGKTILARVIDSAKSLEPSAITIVTGHKGDIVEKQFASDQLLSFCKQKQQLGTANALQSALGNIDFSASHTLVLLGDAPLVLPETLNKLTADVLKDELRVLTAKVQNPHGLGRIIFDENKNIVSIVEEKEATFEQKQVDIINTGVMLLPNSHLQNLLNKVDNNNAKGEFYLTDIIKLAVDIGLKVSESRVTSELEALGINSKLELAIAEREVQRRQAHMLLEQGVTLADPARVDVRGDLESGKDVFIDINTVFQGQVVLADNVTVGPNVIIKDSYIGPNTNIKANSLVDGASIAGSSEVGPFARIRPQTSLGTGAKIGNFVEIKKSAVGEGSKINHLSYVGDAELGVGVNIGAGTITCNYDGKNKHKTVISDGAFIGSDCQLVAPVFVGANALVAAGTTLIKDAPANQLTLNKKQQHSQESEQIKNSALEHEE